MTRAEGFEIFQQLLARGPFLPFPVETDAVEQGVHGELMLTSSKGGNRQIEARLMIIGIGVHRRLQLGERPGIGGLFGHLNR